MPPDISSSIELSPPASTSTSMFSKARNGATTPATAVHTGMYHNSVIQLGSAKTSVRGRAKSLIQRPARIRCGCVLASCEHATTGVQVRASAMNTDTNFVLGLVCLITLATCMAVPCGAQPEGLSDARPGVSGKADPHSYGNPEQIQIQQFELDLTVDFDAKRLNGIVVLDIQRQPDCPTGAPLVLDTRGLTIEKVELRKLQPFRPDPFVPTPFPACPGRSDPGVQAHDPTDSGHDAGSHLVSDICHGECPSVA